jgi:hypothetical protein
MALFTVITVLILTTVHAKHSPIELYPGYGWDQLRFVDMLPIYNVRNSNDSLAMQECIANIPRRKSELEMNSDIIDIYDSSGKTYASKYTVGGGVSFLGIGVSASYSEEYQQMKEQQGREDTVTIRNEIRYTFADVLLLRSCPLDPRFKAEIVEIANHIKDDQQMMATYAAQLFVLHYGTHYTSRFRIGGHIVEENFMKSKELYSSETIKKSSQVSAKASFIGKFSLSASYGSQSGTTTTDINQFEQRVTQRRIISEGGQPFLLGMSLEKWQSTIEDNPIVLQRGVENITVAIDPKQIPEVEEFYVYKAIQEIDKAIETYVKMNLIHGCMQRTSSSFNWLANVDDGSCTGSVSNIQFGGFVRTCQISWETGETSSPRNDLCDNVRVPNFHTNTESCPLGFTLNLLHTTRRTQRYERTESYCCGFLCLGRCQRNIWIGTATSTARLYSCTRSSYGLTQYSFGGSYTSNKINLVTNERRCPPKYRPIRIVNDIDVCYTEQIFDLDNIPKFGGMFSCQTNYLPSSNDACSSGFSPYVMGVIENGCILHACLQLKTRDIKSLPSISLPPYFNILEYINITAPIPMVDDINGTNETDPSIPMINDTNGMDETDPSIPTIRMNPRIIYQDTNSASKTYLSWSFLFFLILPRYLMSSVH